MTLAPGVRATGRGATRSAFGGGWGMAWRVAYAVWARPTACGWRISCGSTGPGSACWRGRRGVEAAARRRTRKNAVGGRRTTAPMPHPREHTLPARELRRGTVRDGGAPVFTPAGRLASLARFPGPPQRTNDAKRGFARGARLCDPLPRATTKPGPRLTVTRVPAAGRVSRARARPAAVPAGQRRQQRQAASACFWRHSFEKFKSRGRREKGGFGRAHA